MTVSSAKKNLIDAIDERRGAVRIAEGINALIAESQREAYEKSEAIAKEEYATLVATRIANLRFGIR